MKLQKLHGKKRSVSGTILYVLAIIIKIIGIAISYLIISDNVYFLGYFEMVADFEDQGIGTLYFGSILMALQCGVLLYSLTHDGYLTGKSHKRPWLKALVFLWSPIQALFVWFREYGYTVMSWEYGVMVLLDIVIFIGCLFKTGSAWANRLRPFKDVKSHHDDWGTKVDDAPNEPHQENIQQVRGQTEAEYEPQGLYTASFSPSRQTSGPKPKIRVDGMSDGNQDRV
jgi:hypothetical protein